MSDEAVGVDVHDVIGLGLPSLPLLVKDVTFDRGDLDVIVLIKKHWAGSFT